MRTIGTHRIELPSRILTLKESKLSLINFSPVVLVLMLALGEGFRAAVCFLTLSLIDLSVGLQLFFFFL